jgi:Tol biopolymer transport system component
MKYAVFATISIVIPVAFCSNSAAFAQSGLTTRISVSSGGTQGNGDSAPPSITPDGRYSAFRSVADDLVAGDVNGMGDVFVHDRVTGSTTLVSVDSAGQQGNQGCESGTSISSDGRYVAFSSFASNLVPGDTNVASDVFVHDAVTGLTMRVSVDSGGIQGNQDSSAPSISADGRYVAFHSRSSNLVVGDTNSVLDIFVYDSVTGQTLRASLDSGGNQGNANSYAPVLSSDGRHVAFPSLATNLVPGDTNNERDAFVHDMLTGQTTLASVDSNGVHGNGLSVPTALSSDARYVVFHGGSTNLVPGDTNNAWDVFVHDRNTGTTERVSVDSNGNAGDSSSINAAISSDGRHVAFTSSATNLVPGDGNGWSDIFVHDRTTGVTERASLSSSGVEGDFWAGVAAISGDGRYIAFDSSSTNLVSGDTNGFVDVFLRDRGLPPPPPFCFGDGSAGACPCGNNGAPARGCENSASTGGAVLSATGSYALSNDTLVLSSSGELPHAASIFLQGSTAIAPANFGDGLRCVGGALKRLYIRSASGGVASAPQTGDPSISARSAALGDVINAGATRYYQTYYRDPVLGFCANPPGGSWNISSGLSVVWEQ